MGRTPVTSEHVPVNVGLLISYSRHDDQRRRDACHAQGALSGVHGGLLILTLGCGYK